jgi:uncharacterized protein (UPF0305 family)
MDKLYNLIYYPEISFRKLLDVLKEDSSQISIREIIQASLFLIDDSKYVQTGYIGEFIKSYTQAFLTRIGKVRNVSMEKFLPVDFQELKKALELLKEQEVKGEVVEGFDPAFSRIYQIISIYTTFMLRNLSTLWELLFLVDLR